MEQIELDFSADGNAVEAVLISPRRRQDFIERIVLTHGRRVHAECLHETGWRRVKMDLRTVLTGTPVLAQLADASSRLKGSYDHLPTEECLALMKELDPHAAFGGPTAGAAAGGAVAVPYVWVQLPDVATATMRIVEAELLDDSRAYDARFTGSDVTNAAIARELLWMTRTLCRSVTLEADAPTNGPFAIRIFPTHNRKECVLPTARLRHFVARRYEAAEANQKRPWRKFTFVVSRVELAEWKCDVKYEFAS